MDKVLSLIGLAKKAGRISEGSDYTENSIRGGKASLVVIASDTSQNGIKAICDCCEYYKVKYIFYATKTELGRTLGAALRSVISINDDGFAAAILKQIAE